MLHDRVAFCMLAKAGLLPQALYPVVAASAAPKGGVAMDAPPAIEAEAGQGHLLLGASLEAPSRKSEPADVEAQLMLLPGPPPAGSPSVPASHRSSAVNAAVASSLPPSLSRKRTRELRG